MALAVVNKIASRCDIHFGFHHFSQQASLPVIVQSGVDPPEHAWHPTPPHPRCRQLCPWRQMESMDIDCPASSTAPYFPPNVVETIARHLWKGDRAPLFDVMSMAGVCRDWRDICSVVPGNLGLDVCLTLDCLEAAQPLSRRAALFRRASLGAQRAFLVGAAKLLRGPGLTGCILRGPGASDGLVLQAARRSGGSWTSLRLENSSEVTDRALLAASAQAGGLTDLSLSGLPRISVRGLTTFASCTSVTTLELADLYALNGGDEGATLQGRQQLSVTDVLLVARLFQSLTKLSTLKLAAPAAVVFAAIRFCPQLESLTYTADCTAALHAVVMVLPSLTQLSALSLTARGFAIPPETARLIGRLPLLSLRLDSAVYESQVSAHRMVLSHIDNDAVKALVDGVCGRWKQFALPVPGIVRKASGEFNEFKLSLRGATGLAHDAVSTLLRLPVLTELDVSGCSRISAMDKMRLVAKVKAGCEVLAGQARRAGQAAGATPVARLDTPAEHCAFFRGEEATHASGPSATGSSALASSGPGRRHA